jgi:cytochrome c biogenesis protein CcmG, thiol:disulfide interchange protein DsbE
MSRRLVAGLVALVALGGVFAYGLSKQGAVSHIDTRNVKVPPSGFKTFAAPPITGATLAGTSFSLASLRGKPAFINFWGTWCPPCRREAPQLRAFADALGKQATMVGVAIDSPRASAIDFVSKEGWHYAIVSRHCCDLNDRYGVVYMPTTIVLNSQGRVVDRLIGPQTAARLEAELHALGA